MFAARYFAARYFAPRYFPQIGLEVIGWLVATVQAQAALTVTTLRAVAALAAEELLNAL